MVRGRESARGIWIRTREGFLWQKGLKIDWIKWVSCELDREELWYILLVAYHIPTQDFVAEPGFIQIWLSSISKFWLVLTNHAEKRNYIHILREKSGSINNKILTVGIAQCKIIGDYFSSLLLIFLCIQTLKIEYPLILGSFPYKGKCINDTNISSSSNVIFDMYIKSSRGKWWTNSELKFY